MCAPARQLLLVEQLTVRVAQRVGAHVRQANGPLARGLRTSTFRLNASAFCEIGGAFRGCSGGV